MNKTKLITPKNIEVVAKVFQLSFLLKTKPQAIIVMARLTNAIKAAIACIKPVGVGGTTGTSVGNIAAKVKPKENKPSVIILGLEVLIFSNNPVSISAAEVAST